MYINQIETICIMSSSMLKCSTDDTTIELPAHRRTQLLMLRRKTNADKILNEVAQPKRSIPVNAPPEYYALSLDSKIPILKGPAACLTFSRNKVGREIFASAGTDFDLDDPYCHTVSYDYQQLHDHNLKHIYDIPKNLRHLKAINMISDDNEVRCTLKQFNEYRRYLKRLYLNKVNILRAQNDENEIDQRNVMLSERITNKFLANCVRREVVLKKRKAFELRQRNAEVERIENFARLQEHYRQIAKRFDRIQEEKRLNVQQKSQKKILCAKERQHQMQRNEKRRIVLLRRKFTLEGRMIPKRLRLHQMEAKNFKDIEEQQINERRGLFRSNRQWLDSQLLIENEVQTIEKVEKRKRLVAELYERDLQNITLKRANFIRSRYQQRNVETISNALFDEIARMVRLQKKVDIEQERREIEDQMAQLKLKSTNESALPSSKVSFASSYEINEELKKFMRKVFGSEKKIITEKSAPYEPQKMTADGLNDFTSGFAALTKAQVHSVVNAAFTTSLALRGSVSTMEVLMEAYQILDRISKGYIYDIPRDSAVQLYVEEQVKALLNTLRLYQVEKIISTKSSGNVQGSQSSRASVFSNSKESFKIAKVKRSSKMIKERRKRTVTFGLTKVHMVSTISIENDEQECSETVPADRAAIGGEIGHINEHTVSIRKIARAVLQMPTDNDHPMIPKAMQERSLAHLYDFQKVAILTNLERFQRNLEYKIEENMLRNFDFVDLKFDSHGFAKIPALPEPVLIKIVMDSVMTLPEKDLLFSDRVILVAYSICMAVVMSVQPIPSPPPFCSGSTADTYDSSE